MLSPKGCQSSVALRRKRNFKNLSLQNSPIIVHPPSPTEAGIKSVDAEYNEVNGRLQDLEIGLELRLDLRAEDIETLEELGAGNGGTVCKVLHKPTKTIMAKKHKVDPKLMVRRQIMREMQYMHDCDSKHIVSFYGAFMNEGDISMCMEYMDIGSLDRVYKKHGPVRQDVLRKIAFAVLDGLIYLYDCHRIIHRDVKPSNVLVNSIGQIKICDFGVSGPLIDSIADTFVGTSYYMSPERILGSPYSVKSDVWSFGMTLLELAIGRFPLVSEDGASPAVFELLQRIVHEPVPTLPSNKTYSAELKSFIDIWSVEKKKIYFWGENTKESGAEIRHRWLIKNLYHDFSL
ncbi:kinase-like domain-containing protein [Umbelopsis sp. AD052]|nr:kinase-like domain-containing protein [Umbelopsis sp. AD052]